VAWPYNHVLAPKGLNDAPPSSLMDSIASPKVKIAERERVGALLGSQHFGGRGVCWSSGMGTRKIDKEFNSLHGLTQTKQQVG